VTGADPDAIARFEPGDALVAPMTSPSYNLLLSLAGALITEEGGEFSHAAIMTRELGLPAVLGVSSATGRIQNGATVTVDPVNGLVCCA
jgi:pyruvate,water dikinase